MREMDTHSFFIYLLISFTAFFFHQLLSDLILVIYLIIYSYVYFRTC